MVDSCEDFFLSPWGKCFRNLTKYAEIFLWVVFRGYFRVGRYNIQYVHHKNHYVYGKTHRTWKPCVCVCVWAGQLNGWNRSLRSSCQTAPPPPVLSPSPPPPQSHQPPPPLHLSVLCPSLNQTVHSHKHLSLEPNIFMFLWMWDFCFISHFRQITRKITKP